MELDSDWNDLNSRRVLIIAMLEVVKTGEEVGKKIGDPIDWANGN